MITKSEDYAFHMKLGLRGEKREFSAMIRCLFSSAARQMPRDLCTAPGIISLSRLSLATDVTDSTLGASGLWLGTRTGAGGTVTLA